MHNLTGEGFKFSQFLLKFLACTKANLIATSQQELITIKVPPTTAESRQKLAKGIDTITAEFETKCAAFTRSKYTLAIAAAPQSAQYATEMEESSSAKAFAAHLHLTLSKLTEDKITALKSAGQRKRSDLLGLAKSSKKSKKKK